MVEIIYNYKLNKINLKLINIFKRKIKLKFKKNYNFTYKLQKYTLQTILEKIFFIIYYAKNWRLLGYGWNNIYKHYIKFTKFGIFKDTYLNLLKKYLCRNKTSLKIVSADTTFIYNKYGINKKARNKFAKNKNCSKLFLIVDLNKKPIYFSFCSGNINDTKILNNNMSSILKNLEGKTKYFLADSGFCSKNIRKQFILKNIKTLIPKNIRNTKKNIKMKDLSFAEKIKILFADFSTNDEQIYKNRIRVENFYSNFKQIYRFNMRYDKFSQNLEGFIYIHFSNLLIK